MSDRTRNNAGRSGVTIIAEAGSNHDGDIETAKKLIDIAADAGADAVKFQSFRASDLLVPSDPDYELLASIELPHKWLSELKVYADSRDIGFCSTPFDAESVNILDDLGVPFFKIASGDITYEQLLRYVARKGKGILLSTGKSDEEDIDRAISWIHDEGNYDVVLLHCISKYPAAISELNLRVLTTMRDKYDVTVGLSDHTEEPYVPALAVAMGARVIEKHFTYDKKAKGPDHSYALSPDELKEMVQIVREAESALGNGVKVPGDRELGELTTGRRGIYASRDISKGEKLGIKDVLLVRPQVAAPVYCLSDYLGCSVNKNIKMHSPIFKEDIA